MCFKKILVIILIKIRENVNKTKKILIKYILSRKIYLTRKGVLLKFLS